MYVLGCTPLACKACTCPTSRPEKRSRNRWQRHQEFNGWGSLSDTPPRAVDSRQDKAVVFTTTGRGSFPVVGELISGWLINCQGNYHSGDSSDLKIRTVTSWGQGEFSSITQWCPTLSDPMDCSVPGLPVHHQLPELTQSHVHRVGDTNQPSHPLSSPSSPVFNLSKHRGLFQWVSSSHQMAKLWVLEFQLQHQSLQWIFRTDFL